MDKKTRKEIRNELMNSAHDLHRRFDKTLITLSGGALAISLSFIQNVIGGEKAISKIYALLAWCSWAFSLTSILLALYFATLHYGDAIRKLDKGDLDNNKAVIKYSKLIPYLNKIGTIFFMIGVFLFIIFTYKNIRV